MKRCTTCILPETFPGIEYDRDGVCNYCRSYQPVEVYGEEELEKVLASYRNRGGRYDCIAPVSGGRDSSFVLHQMVKKYNMRTLALTVDSGFITSEGVRNLKQITDVLGVEHVVLKDERRIATAKSNARKKFHGWLEKPSINTIIPILNSGDKTMNLQMARYAKEHDIPLVLGGNIIGNSTIEKDHWKTGFMGIVQEEDGSFSRYDKAKLLLLLLKEYMGNRANYQWPILKEYLAGAAVYFFEPLFIPKGVDFLGFYDYIYWDEKQIVSTVCDELGWMGADDTSATWRIDDAAYPLINYLYYRLVGFTEHDELYSKMVREGQLTRDEALERCLADHKPRLSLIRKDFEELEVTRKQVDEALATYKEKLWRQYYGKRSVR